MVQRSQQGRSLVELMVALTAGLILMGGVLMVYVQGFAANSNQMRISRLNHELRTVMNQITRDMRRAGHVNWMAALPAGNDFLSISPQTIGDVDPAVPRITVRYDLDADGVVEANEVYEYRWADANGDQRNDTIQTRVGAGAWSNLIDPEDIRITNFRVVRHTLGPITPSGSTVSVNIPAYFVEIRGVLARGCPPPNCMDGQSCPEACQVRTLHEMVRMRNNIFQ